jgi:hypothetical protein
MLHKQDVGATIDVEHCMVMLDQHKNFSKQLHKLLLFLTNTCNLINDKLLPNIFVLTKPNLNRPPAASKETFATKLLPVNSSLLTPSK